MKVVKSVSYGLLPNSALIVAACKYYGIKKDSNVLKGLISLEVIQ